MALSPKKYLFGFVMLRMMKKHPYVLPKIYLTDVFEKYIGGT
jgi:hypothetical protein